MLVEVAKYHKEWLDVVKSLGGDSYSEDIVQEMYLKITKYTNPQTILSNGILNKGYIYFTLKSILYTYFKEKARVTKLSDNCLYNIRAIYNDERNQADEIISDKIEAEINTWHWYDKEIFNRYRNNATTYRDIANQTTIHWVSIYRVIKRLKEKLKDKIGEDYEDYINQDYELIK